MTIRRLASALALAAVAALSITTPAAGSCGVLPGSPEQVDAADVVFVGTVRQVSNGHRTAVVEVHEVWRGPALGHEVTVHGGPDDPGISSSVDRTYEDATRYLFAVRADGGRLLDDSCSGTQIWTDDLRVLAPVSRSAPSAGAADPSPSADVEEPGRDIWPIVAVVGVMAVIGAASFMAFRTAR